MTELDERAEAMRESEVHEDPPWCTRPADEHEHERHVGKWQVAARLDIGGGWVLEVRPERAWWQNGEEADCEWRVALQIRHEHRTDWVLGIDLDDDGVNDLHSLLDECRDQAQEELDDDWAESFPGAAELEEARNARAAGGSSG